MDENTWKIVQIGMWIIGIQTAFLSTIIGALWHSMNKRFDEMDNRLSTRIDKVNERIDKLSDKVEDVDRRLCRIEGSLATQGHCLFSQTQTKEKVQ